MKIRKHLIPLLIGLAIACGACSGDGEESIRDAVSHSNPIDWIDFSIQNKDFIVDIGNAETLPPGSIRGLISSEQSLTVWKELGERLTNVVSLEVTSSAPNLNELIFEAAVHFPHLEYFHLQARQACEIAPSITALAKLQHLRYMGIDAPSATNISARIYDVKTVKDLLLRVGSVSVPNGIAGLQNLRSLQLYGKSERPVRSLPSDLAKCSVERLIFMNLPHLATMMPTLPAKLTELSAVGCHLTTVPDAWLRHDKLQCLDLNKNNINVFPSDLRQAPSLELISLECNAITDIPPIRLAPGSRLKIALLDNPVKNLSSENKSLIQSRRIEIQQ